jgi:hypothetical protein
LLVPVLSSNAELPQRCSPLVPPRLRIIAD